MDSQQLKQARLDKKLLSNVSKMPGYSISRSAWLCGVGSRLAEIPAAHAKTATHARACITCPTSRPR